MPKKKTSKTAAKRFRRTAGGKFRHARAGTSHLLGAKTRKRKRHLRAPAVLSRVERRRIATLISS